MAWQHIGSYGVTMRQSTSNSSNTRLTISDHNILFLNLCTEVSSTKTLTITYRNVQHVDHTKFAYFHETTITGSHPND